MREDRSRAAVYTPSGVPGGAHGAAGDGPGIRPRLAGRAVAVLCAIAVALAAGCSLSTGGSGADSDALVLVTHDSFVLSDGVLQQFTDRTGVPVDVRAGGDAGQLASQLVLTKDDPTGDVAFGIDNTFASRVTGQGVFDDYVSPKADGGADRYDLPGNDELTAVDYGDVCLNYDSSWFDGRGVSPPSSIADLTAPQYEDLTVVENPATSSPGLAFLLGTIVSRPDDAPPGAWKEYWKALKDNGVKVENGWTQAYDVDFSGASGGGSRPIVVSYATSPPAEVGDDGAAPPTRVVESSCFRQVEYAGVLHGTHKPEIAREFIDFLLSEAVQKDVPGQMYVMPVQRGTPLPETFNEYAARPAHPLSMSPERIGDNRDDWIGQWRRIVLG